MDTDTFEGSNPDEAAEGATDSVWGHVEGAGHAVAGAWDVLNGSMNHAMSEGFRLIGDEKDAQMSDQFMEQRWASATEHFKQMHKDFDGTTDGATDSLDGMGDGDQGDWDGGSDASETDSSYDESESNDTDDYSDDSSDDYSDDSAQDSPEEDYAQDSFDVASDGDMGEGDDEGE